MIIYCRNVELKKSLITNISKTLIQLLLINNKNNCKNFIIQEHCLVLLTNLTLVDYVLFLKMEWPFKAIKNKFQGKLSLTSTNKVLWKYGKNNFNIGSKNIPTFSLTKLTDIWKYVNFHWPIFKITVSFIVQELINSIQDKHLMPSDSHHSKISIHVMYV